MPRNIKLYKDILSPKFCRQLIETFEKDPAVAPDPQPDYSTRHYLKISDSKKPSWIKPVNKFYEKLEQVTQIYFDLPEKYAGVTLPEWSDDGLVMSRYSKGDSLVLHVDGHSCTPPNNYLRLATVVFFLNTLENSGELFFPLQNKKIKPVAGQCIIFPPTLEYPHEVFECKETRYIIQTWITDPYLVVSPALI